MFMTKQNDIKRIKEIAELELMRSGEGGECLDYPELMIRVMEKIKDFPDDEKVNLSSHEISSAVRDAKDEFCDSWILSLPDDDDFGF
jgi:hypothetical protein